MVVVGGGGGDGGGGLSRVLTSHGHIKTTLTLDVDNNLDIYQLRFLFVWLSC